MEVKVGGTLRDQKDVSKGPVPTYYRNDVLVAVTLVSTHLGALDRYVERIDYVFRWLEEHRWETQVKLVVRAEMGARGVSRDRTLNYYRVREGHKAHAENVRKHVIILLKEIVEYTKTMTDEIQAVLTEDERATNPMFHVHG